MQHVNHSGVLAEVAKGTFKHRKPQGEPCNAPTEVDRLTVKLRGDFGTVDSTSELFLDYAKRSAFPEVVQGVVLVFTPGSIKNSITGVELV